MKRGSSRGFSEAETRRKLIDQKLGHAGWGLITPYNENREYTNESVTEYKTAKGPADYVLFHKGKPLAIVEAKKIARGVQSALNQAQRYAEGFTDSDWDFHGYRIPFIYSTNGVVIWFQDLRDKKSRSRRVAQFHTPEALREILDTGKSTYSDWLSQNPEIGTEYLRDYQKEAVKAIESELEKGKRRMMLAMATGTGKTFTAISLLYRLIKSGFAKRILFLVDRKALAVQAVSSMSVYEPEPGLKFDKIYEVYSQQFHRSDMEDQDFDIKILQNHYLTNPTPDLSFVYVCTIQRMRINLFGNPTDEVLEEEDAEQIDIPIHGFDVIIADECHRGYTTADKSKWREVLEHFDAVQIGLTATPAMHSMAYFKHKVYEYRYEQAVKDGYLVDYDAIQIMSDIRMNGVFLREGDHVTLVDTSSGERRYDLLEDEREFDTSKLERDVTAPDSNRKIVRAFAKHALEQEKQLGRFPKTLVFAVNDLDHQSHSDQLVEILRDEFGQGDAFVEKITGKADRPLKLIRKFRNRPEPKIIVTVDMVTTGVDIPCLENLLFLRPVKSRILFDQMIGRGTRLCSDLFPSKDHFSVYDAVGVIDYFKDASDFTENPPSRPSRSFAVIVEDVLNNVDREYNINLLSKRMLRVAKNISLEGREVLKQFIPDGDIGKFAVELPEKLLTDFENTKRILTDEQFLDIMVNYERSPKMFVIADDALDVVGSEVRFRTTDGRHLKPDEYLKAFEEYVKKNPDRLTALEILLNKPSDFKLQHLRELREKLESLPERFTESRLSKARKMKPHIIKELTDIVSLIREIVISDSSNPDERAAQAIERVRKQLDLTSEQEMWLHHIRAFLPKNLIITREDFRNPPFSRIGGWSKADRTFDGQLENILNVINEVMIAWTSTA